MVAKPCPSGCPANCISEGPGWPEAIAANRRSPRSAFFRIRLTRRPGARVYRTGDRVRWRSDGLLEFLGRRDGQVKIRGFRVEPQEIEHALMTLPEVSRAAVVASGDGADRRLVGYVVLAGGAAITPSEIQNRLRDRLPDYMVPSHVMAIDALPLRANGKVDQARLPEWLVSSADSRAAAPRSETEARLADIWCAVLGRSTIGSTDNFFDLGGHSLTAARMLARVDRHFGRRLPLVAVFEAPTIGQHGRAARRSTTAVEGTVRADSTGRKPAATGRGWRRLVSPAAGGASRCRSTGIGRVAGRVGARRSVSTICRHRHRVAARCQAARASATDRLRALRLLPQRSAGVRNRARARVTRTTGATRGALRPAQPRGLDATGDAGPSIRRSSRASSSTCANCCGCDYTDMPAYVGARTRWLWQRVRLATMLARDDSRGEGHTRAAESIGDALYVAASRYQPQPYAGPVLLIGSQDPVGDRWEQTHRHWTALAHRFTSHLSQGDHTSLFDEPHVAGVADRLGAALSDASIASSQPASIP